jgi:hypothetical protein
MIEKDGRKIFMTCDSCKKREFVREITGLDLLKMKVEFPKGWGGYDNFGQTKLTFCSNEKCQKVLDKLCAEDERGNEKKLAKENWSKQIVNE